MPLLYALSVRFDDPYGIAEVTVVAESEQDARDRAVCDTGLSEFYSPALTPVELLGRAASDQARVQVTYR